MNNPRSWPSRHANTGKPWRRRAWFVTYYWRGGPQACFCPNPRVAARSYCYRPTRASAERLVRLAERLVREKKATLYPFMAASMTGWVMTEITHET